MSRRAVTALLLAAAAAAGCVDRLEAHPPECVVSEDCNQGAGEICDEGRCWGDPPPGPFSVALGAPTERFYDLALTELRGVEIQDDGWIPNLVVNDAAYLRGRIEGVCEGCRDGVGIAATITVKRESTIPGGHELVRQVSVLGDDGGYESFAIPLPPILGSDEPLYQVTIEPSTSGELFPGGPPPAAVLPPLRLTYGLGALQGSQTIVVDASDVRVVSGRIVNSVGQGIGGMRVEARARIDLDIDQPLDRVSTVVTSQPDGAFVLLISDPDLTVVDVIARPAEGVLAPTLIAHDRFVGDASTELELEMPSYAGVTRISLPVVAADTAGNPVEVASAKVQLTCRLGDPSGVEAVFTVEGMTDGDGVFSADVLGGSETGARRYDALIYPGGESQHASRTDVVVEVGPQGGVLPTVELASRSTLTGVIVDAHGEPVEGVRIEAEPALDFLWNLEAEAQALLNDRPVAFTQSLNGGAFTLWVDPEAGGRAATYDLVLLPQGYSQVPAFVVKGVSGAGGQDLGELRAPDGADVRGLVTDWSFVPVSGADVAIYATQEQLDLCATATNAPEDCQPPAIKLASGKTDADGIVRLVLPR